MIISYANPSLAVADDADAAWSAVLARPAIVRALAAVGDLRSADFGPQPNLGTAWLIRSDLAVTNAHVTRRLAARLACGAAAVTLDLRAAPIDRDAHARAVLAVVHQDDEHDLAFVRLAPGDPSAPTLALADGAPGDHVAVIGYPSHSVGHYDPAEVRRMFSGRFDVKRLAPGRITAADPRRVDHDCTTLGGCSGAPLVDLARGAVVGVHYGGAGRFRMNWAVPAAVVAARLVGVGA